MGHLFGLVHPPTDVRNETPPDIMSTAYNWGANGFSANGGYVDQRKRQVTQGNIDAMNLSTLKYDKTGKANLGAMTNVYHIFGHISKLPVVIK